MANQQDKLLETWRLMLADSSKSWVLFENGTCVFVADLMVDPVVVATELLRVAGPVGAGSKHGDFGYHHLKDNLGWAISCHDENILTLVLPEEMPARDPAAGACTDASGGLAAGLLGRTKRGKDAEALRIVLVQDRRVPAPHRKMPFWKFW